MPGYYGGVTREAVSMQAVLRVCCRSVLRPLRNKQALAIFIGVILAVYVMLATDVITLRSSRRSDGTVITFDATDAGQEPSQQQQHQDVPILSQESASLHNDHDNKRNSKKPPPPPFPHRHNPNSPRLNTSADNLGPSVVFHWTDLNTHAGGNSSSNISNNSISISSNSSSSSSSKGLDNTTATTSANKSLGEVKSKSRVTSYGVYTNDNRTEGAAKGNHSNVVVVVGEGGGGTGSEPHQTGSGYKRRGPVVKGDKERESVSASASTSTSTSSSVILAGVPRSRKVFLTIGMVTVKREKADYFFSTVDSLFERAPSSEQREITIVVMLADRTQANNDQKLRDIQERYPAQLSSGLLLVIRGPDTDYIFNNTRVKRTFNDSLVRVQWRSKQNVDYAAVMDFAANLSTYYLHIEDDVIAAHSYLRHIREFLKANENKNWAMLSVCPHGFIGKLFKSQDLPKLVMILRSFYLEQPCDFLINYFMQLMTQSKHIARSGNLFFHQGKFSSLVNQTRKTDKLSGAGGGGGSSKDKNKIDKSPRKEVNPSAAVSSNLTVYQAHTATNAYDLQTSDFLWAVDIAPGQRLTVVFSKAQTLGRVVIRTGHSDQNLKDSLQNGRVEMSTKAPSPSPSPSSSPLVCPESRTVGHFREGYFDVTLKPVHDIMCFSVVITGSQEDWLIIRDIAVTVA